MIIIGPKHNMNFKKTKQHVRLKRKQSVIYEFLRVSKELHREFPLLNYIEKTLDDPGGRPYEKRVEKR